MSAVDKFRVRRFKVYKDEKVSAVITGRLSPKGILLKQKWLHYRAEEVWVLQALRRSSIIWLGE